MQWTAVKIFRQVRSDKDSFCSGKASIGFIREQIKQCFERKKFLHKRGLPAAHVETIKWLLLDRHFLSEV